MNSIYVGLAGILGALSRYGISLIGNPTTPDTFPWGTLICNFLGCFLLGFMAFALIPQFPNRIRLSITSGFIGSFTTFSAISVETLQMLREAAWGLAIGYVLISIWGGLALVWVGYRAAAYMPIRRV